MHSTPPTFHVMGGRVGGEGGAAGKGVGWGQAKEVGGGGQAKPVVNTGTMLDMQDGWV